MIQNCHLTFDNVLIDASQRLPGAKDFMTGTNKVLKHSRIFVCWMAAGTSLGVYDHAIKYASNRIQFGKPISSIYNSYVGYQLTQ